MKNIDWIRKYYCSDDLERYNSNKSLLSLSGDIYNYGDHYPLMFEFREFDIINTQGFGVTTARHINLATRITGNPISINISQGSDLLFNVREHGELGVFVLDCILKELILLESKLYKLTKRAIK